MNYIRKFFLALTGVGLTGCVTLQSPSPDLAETQACLEPNFDQCQSWVLLFEPEGQRGCTGAIIDEHPHILTSWQCIYEISTLANGFGNILVAIGSEVQKITFVDRHPDQQIDLAVIGLRRGVLAEVQKKHPEVGPAFVSRKGWANQDNKKVSLVAYGVSALRKPQEAVLSLPNGLQRNTPFTDGTVNFAENSAYREAYSPQEHFQIRTVPKRLQGRWGIAKNNFVGLSNTDRGGLAFADDGFLIGIYSQVNLHPTDFTRVDSQNEVVATYMDLTNPRVYRWIEAELMIDRTDYAGGASDFDMAKIIASYREPAEIIEPLSR